MKMQDDWKREINRLHLTEIQKERMMDQVKYGKKKKKSYVGFVLPAFVALALFSTWLAVQPGNAVRQTASQVETVSEASSVEIIIWLTLTLGLMMSAYSLAVVSLLNVKRWQNSKGVHQIVVFLKSYRIMWVIMSLLGFSFAVVMIASKLESPTAFLQFLFILFLFANTSLVQILFTRNEQRAHCPHCKTEVTHKEMLKKSFMFYNARCSACQRKMYNDRKRSKNMYVIQVLGMPVCLLMPSIGIPFYLIGMYAIFYLVFLFGYLFPYTVRFTTQSEEQQPPLW